MKWRALIILVIIAVAGVALIAPRRPVDDLTPLADQVPASAVVYVGLRDASAPRPAWLDRLAGARPIPAGLTSAALYATLEDGALRWHAVGLVYGRVVHDGPAPSGPMISSRPEFRAAFAGAPSNIRVWVDVQALGLGGEFSALALDVEGANATGLALYRVEARGGCIEKSRHWGRVGRLADAPFAAGGSDGLEIVARRLGLDARLLAADAGPEWGCVLRDGEIVLFARSTNPARARQAIARIGSANYRFEDGWCLWASDSRALDGFAPEMGGSEHVVVHFTPDAARDLERQGLYVPAFLESLGAFDASWRYRSGGAEVKIRFR